MALVQGVIWMVNRGGWQPGGLGPVVRQWRGSRSYHSGVLGEYKGHCHCGVACHG